MRRFKNQLFKELRKNGQNLDPQDLENFDLDPDDVGGLSNIGKIQYSKKQGGCGSMRPEVRRAITDKVKSTLCLCKLHMLEEITVYRSQINHFLNGRNFSSRYLFCL